jgi:hypothetical protein
MTIRIALVAAAAITLLDDLPARAQAQQAFTECRPITQREPRTRPLNRRERADSVRWATRRQVRDALTADVVEAARRGGIAQPEGLVVLKVDTRRPEQAEVTLWAANVPDSLVHGVVAARAALLATLSERETTLDFRLNKVPPGEVVGDTTLSCLPRLLNPRQLRGEVVRAFIRDNPLPPGGNPRLNVQVRMLITHEGAVAYAELSRRASVSTLNSAVLEGTRRLLFAPASYKGVPYDAWVELPVQLDLGLPAESRRPRPRPGIF